jgi:hypothetical protein
VYFYPPVENIIETEALIGEAIRTANSTNKDLFQELRAIFIDRATNSSDYGTRETFYRISKGKLYSQNNYLASLGTPYTTKENWNKLFEEVNRVINSIGYTNYDNLLHNTTKIRYAAYLTYMMEAKRYFPSMLLASIMYLAAIVLILAITVDQSRAVLTAAGWL